MGNETVSEKLSKAAENVPLVYESGYTKGRNDGYDLFWDAIQNGGDYSCSNPDNLGIGRVKHTFGKGWTNDVFRPKYKVEVLDPSCFEYTDIEDLRPEAVGNEIDFSRLTNFNYIFRCSAVKHVGVVDMTNAKYGWCLFHDANALETVEKVILPPSYTDNIVFKHLGFWAPKLCEIRFENYFYADVWFSYAPLLSHESLTSIVTALYDYADDPGEYSDRNKTLTLGATNLAKLTSAEKAAALEKGWTLT